MFGIHPSVGVYLTLPRPLADRGTHIYRCTHGRCVEASGSRGFTFQIRQDINHQTCQSCILAPVLEAALHTDGYGEHFQQVQME